MRAHRSDARKAQMGGRAFEFLPRWWPDPGPVFDLATLRMRLASSSVSSFPQMRWSERASFAIAEAEAEERIAMARKMKTPRRVARLFTSLRAHLLSVLFLLKVSVSVSQGCGNCILFHVDHVTHANTSRRLTVRRTLQRTTYSRHSPRSSLPANINAVYGY